LTAANAADVAAICRTVEGLPLAIELAAALTDRYTCAEILQLIRQNLDALAEPAADRPLRQRSMRAVFEEFWSSWSARHAALLAGCAVFQGGFTVAAAAAVLQVRPEDLKPLLDTSYLSRDSEGRYHMHALLRQFVAQKGEDDEALYQFHVRHARYYLRPFEQATILAWHTVSEATLRELSQEQGNIQKAWQWAVQARDLPLIGRSLDGLC
jgi:predicted ATPase